MATDHEQTQRTPQAEKRERMLRNEVLRIQRTGGDWRVLAKRLCIQKPYARQLWKRVLEEAEPNKPRKVRRPRTGSKPNSTFRIRSLP